MNTMLNAEVARIRRADVLREAADERLARSVREAADPAEPRRPRRLFHGLVPRLFGHSPAAAAS